MLGILVSLLFNDFKKMPLLRVILIQFYDFPHYQVPDPVNLIHERCVQNTKGVK